MIALVGLLVAWVALFGGPLIAGVPTATISSLPAAMMVLGGTLAAGMVHAGMATWITGWRLFPTIFWPNSFNGDDSINRLVHWCQLSRRNGPLSLDSDINKEPDAYLRLGLQLIVDGADDSKLRQGLLIAREAQALQWRQGADFFSTLGGYAAAMGLVSALYGLAQLDLRTTQTLSASIDIKLIVASVFYGTALSCLFLLPVAGRLRIKAAARQRHDQMAADGFVAILEGENPRVLEHRLREYRL